MKLCKTAPFKCAVSLSRAAPHHARRRRAALAERAIRSPPRNIKCPEQNMEQHAEQQHRNNGWNSILKVKTETGISCTDGDAPGNAL
jgi:hypothetical protein